MLSRFAGGVKGNESDGETVKLISFLVQGFKENKTKQNKKKLSALEISLSSPSSGEKHRASMDFCYDEDEIHIPLKHYIFLVYGRGKLSFNISCQLHLMSRH